MDQSHAFAEVGALHPDRSHEARRCVGGEIYLCFSVAENMHMGGLVIIRENHKPESFRPQNRDHK